jgi:aspartyl-tRNA(Asn)/glutamyl-tRNA(Gln) amidotransferase subunit A
MMSLSLHDLGRRFRDGSLAPGTVVQGCLARIAELDTSLGCFFQVMGEMAIADARKADTDFASRIDRGPLQGIPFAVADVIDVAGLPTTCGSRLTGNEVADTTAPVVQRLRDAGAILLGKISIFEFGVGSPGEDSRYPQTRNPHDQKRAAGATGAGAAVATGMVPFAIAPDTGGAARGSAALCGVAGLKPSIGLVSCQGIFPVARSLDHCGVIAQSAEDIAVILPILMETANAPPSPHRSAPTADALRGLKVSVATEDSSTHAGMKSALARAATISADHGASLTVVSIDYLEQIFAAGQIILATECFAVHRRTLLEHPELYGRGTRHRMIVGAFLEPADYAKAQHTAERLAKRFDEEIMARCDVLLWPAANGPAPLIEDSPYGVAGRSGAYTLAFNVTGHPAISVPCGCSDGLPLGMQMVGQRLADVDLLFAARAFADATAHFTG